MSKFLGIDASTQSMTGLLIDTETASIEVEVSVVFDDHFADRYGIVNGVLDLGDGVVHSAPLMWVEALELMLEQLRAQGGDLSAVRALAGSGQQHGTVYLDATAATVLKQLDPRLPLVDQLRGVFSRATAPIWMDTSTASQCRAIEHDIGGRARLLEVTGNTAFERFSGPQIRKFQETDPQAYAATAHIGLVSSFMASILAGRLVPVDPGDGSGTNLMDMHTRQWSVEAQQATAPGLAGRMPPVMPATQVVGPLSPYFAARHGFSADCMVLPFSGDNPCSLVGMGLVEAGQVALSLGTSDTLFACLDVPRVSATGEGALFVSSDDVHYLALVCFLNGSLAREAVRDRYGLDWHGFAAMLDATPVGNNGALMLPYFAPEIAPHVSTPTVVRQGLAADDAAGNVRAVIEAQALSSRLHSQWMEQEFRSLYVTGGAAANAAILQVFADVHGCPVQRFETTNAAALGAALRACFGARKALGHEHGWRDLVAPFTKPVAGSTIRPRAAATSLYQKKLREYRALEAQQGS